MLNRRTFARGLATFDDPAARHLPGDFELPELDGRPVTPRFEPAPSLEGDLLRPQIPMDRQGGAKY